MDIVVNPATQLTSSSAAMHDTSKRWTFVDQSYSFDGSGQIYAVSMSGCSSNTDRCPSKLVFGVGVFRPTETNCVFNVTGTRMVSTSMGSETITLAEPLPYEKGDQFGFFWKRYGAIGYDPSSSFRYCNAKRIPKYGETLHLKENQAGYRDYYIWPVHRVCGSRPGASP
jgi:hypothetical protein